MPRPGRGFSTIYEWMDYATTTTEFHQYLCIIAKYDGMIKHFPYMASLDPSHLVSIYHRNCMVEFLIKMNTFHTFLGLNTNFNAYKLVCLLFFFWYQNSMCLIQWHLVCVNNSKQTTLLQPSES